MKDLIEKYFEGTLSEIEKIEFDLAVSNNPDFSKELAFQKNVKTAILLNERNKLKNTLRNIENRQNEVIPKQSPFKTWFFVTAAALITVIGGLYYFSQIEKKQEASLYLTYHEVYPNIIAPNVRGNNPNELKNKAFMAYEAEDFLKAKELFGQIENEEFANFYIGLCNLELDLPAETIAKFSQTTFSNSPFPFETYRKWYLALAYLKTNDVVACKVLLNELSKSDNLQAKKAEELLKKL